MLDKTNFVDYGASETPVAVVSKTAATEDHCFAENPLRPVSGRRKPSRKRRVHGDTQDMVALADDDGARLAGETQRIADPVIVEIVQTWRLRQRWHRAEKSLILQGKAFCRAWVNGGEKVAASALFDRASAGEDVPIEVMIALAPYLKAIENFAPERRKLELQAQKLVKALPVFAWVSKVKGFGAGNLVGIIGEAGDIGAYRNPSCLWKRMGLAVIDGEKQGKRTNADEALMHGYSPRRRSVAYLLGESLSKHQLTSAEKSGTPYGAPAGPYGEVYVARRTRTAETHPDWTKAHSVNDARRVMTKAVLRDLWAEWRK